MSGPSPNTSCIFPFKFNEITYYKCTTAYFGTDKPAWCSTLVDASGKHVGGGGNYGFCEQDCNLKIGEKITYIFGAWTLEFKTVWKCSELMYYGYL